MLIYSQPSRREADAAGPCRRCGQWPLDAGVTVCIRCRAQEEVARHIPPAQRWNLFR